MQAKPRISSRWWWSVATLLLLVVGWVNLPSCRSSATDGAGKWLNHSVDVTYTGMKSCQPCHAEIYKSYVETNMGHSFYVPDSAPVVEDFGDSAVVYDKHSDYYYRPIRRGKGMSVLEYRLNGKDTVYKREEKVDYVVGSGFQTRSYMIERNGWVFEVPITWYVARKKWDLSPGYHDGNNARFNRPIGAECMDCHNGLSTTVPNTLNRYVKIGRGIDCERCHGPGSLHVERMQKDEIVDVGKVPDYSIVNPKKLSVALQFDVCQQCHLQGITVPKMEGEFRAGMALADVREVFVERKGGVHSFGIASHAERLMRSSCFQKSAGKLTCTSCHDPHKNVTHKAAESWNKTCESCHTQGHKTCAASAATRQGKNNSCISCHMNKGGTNDIPHVSFTDHYIRVIKDVVPTGLQKETIELICATQSNPSAMVQAQGVVNFLEQQHPPAHWLDTAARYLSASNDPFTAARFHLLKHEPEPGLHAIIDALRKKPNDVAYRMVHAELLQMAGKLKEAFAVYEKLHQESKHHVEAAIQCGILTLKIAPGSRDALDKARKYFQAALQEKPFDEQALANMGFVEMNAGNLELAGTYLKKALAYDPDHAKSLENTVFLYVLQDKKLEAKKVYQHLVRRHPEYTDNAALKKAVE